MENKKILKQVDSLYDSLQSAYEEAGSLRDQFTGIGGKREQLLKEHCNTIRGKIYELRLFRGGFKAIVNDTEE